MFKNVKKTFLTLSFLGLLTLSCNQRDISLEKKSLNDDNSLLLSKNSHPSESIKEFGRIVQSKYNATLTVSEDGIYILTYEDKRVLVVKINSDETFEISGSKIGNRTFIGVQKSIPSNENPAASFSFELVNTQNGLIERPCDQHPKGESFNECFKREWDEFCDGLVSCVAQSTHPRLVSAVITAHCLLC